eukprot:5357579-Karenia_brevis.AAC.1
MTLPKWREVEVGAPTKKEATRPRPEIGAPAFPSGRWPSENEAKIHGYKTVKDWFLAFRAKGQKLGDAALRMHAI